jgi:hypothetical protein
MVVVPLEVRGTVRTPVFKLSTSQVTYVVANGISHMHLLICLCDTVDNRNVPSALYGQVG